MRRNRRILALTLLLGATLAFAPRGEAREAATEPLVRLPTALDCDPQRSLAHRLPETHSELAILAPEEASSDGQETALERSGSIPPSFGWTSRGNARTAPLRSTDILLLIQRQNE